MKKNLFVVCHDNLGGPFGLPHEFRKDPKNQTGCPGIGHRFDGGPRSLEAFLTKTGNSTGSILGNPPIRALSWVKIQESEKQRFSINLVYIDLDPPPSFPKTHTLPGDVMESKAISLNFF